MTTHVLTISPDGPAGRRAECSCGDWRRSGMVTGPRSRWPALLQLVALDLEGAHLQHVAACGAVPYRQLDLFD